MTSNDQPLFDEIRQQLAVILGTVQTALSQNRGLYQDDLQHLKDEVLKLNQLILAYHDARSSLE
jgi:hypothetical protein